MRRLEFGAMVSFGLPMDPQYTATDMPEAINSFALRAEMAVSGAVGCAGGHQCLDAPKTYSLQGNG